MITEYNYVQKPRAHTSMSPNIKTFAILCFNCYKDFNVRATMYQIQTLSDNACRTHAEFVVII